MNVSDLLILFVLSFLAFQEGPEVILSPKTA